MNLKTSQKGFTIVELLIVIVVIAILAAISIVAYVGIQNNARASERQSDAANIAKVAETYFAENSTYPSTVAAFSAATNAKLPANVTVKTTASGGGTNLTNAVVPTQDNTNSPSVTNGVKSYFVRLCGATTGGTVSYFDPRNGESAKVVSFGQGCTP